MSSRLKPVVKREDATGQFLLVVIAAVLGATVALWVAGEVAAFVHSHTWPRLTLGDMGVVLIKLARHPNDPTGAWPPAVRGQMPGPVAFYAIFAVVLFLGTALLLYASLLFTALSKRVSSVRPLPAAPRGPAAASWAPPQLFRDLFVREPMPGRVTLGRVQGRPLAAAPLQSVIVVGPTQSQKTAGLVIPAILEWEGPVLAACVKPDVIRSTMTWRYVKGDVFLYDPTGASGQESSSWSPLSGCESFAGAYRTARLLLATGVTLAAPGPERDVMLDAGAVRLLATLLYAAARTKGLGMADVAGWVQRQDDRDAASKLSAILEPDADEGSAWIQDLGDLRDPLFKAVRPAIAAYEDPTIKEGPLKSRFSAETLLGGGANTVYVCAPAHEQRRLGPLFVALVQQVIDLAFERAAGRMLNPPLLLALDDVAVSAPLPQLDVLASSAAARGIQLVTSVRNLTQLQSRYGEQAESVFANHRAKIVMSGVRDKPTLTLLSHLLGDESLAAAAPPSAEDHVAARPRGPAAALPAPAELLQRIWPGHGLLLYGHLPPAYLTLRPWFRDRHLSAMVAGHDLRSRQRA